MIRNCLALGMPDSYNDIDDLTVKIQRQKSFLKGVTVFILSGGFQMITIAFIGFGVSVREYHIPYVEKREDKVMPEEQIQIS